MTALKPLLGKMDEVSALRLESKIFRLSEKAQNILKTSGAKNNLPISKNLVAEMVSEVEDLYQKLQESLSDSDNKLLYENKLEKIYKDLNQLMERNMKNRLSEVSLGFDIELGDDVDDAAVDALKKALEDSELEIDLGDEREEEGGDEGDEGDALDLEDEGGKEDKEGAEEGGEEEGGGDELADLNLEEPAGKKEESRRLSDNMIVEIDEGMLRREISRMKALREAADDVQAWGHGAGDVSDDMDFEDDDLGDPLDMDLSESDVVEMYEEDGAVPPVEEEDLPEIEEMMQATDVTQAMGPGAASNQRKAQSRNIPESLRRRLAAEMKLQTEAKGKAKKAAAEKAKAKKKAADAKAKAKKKATEAKANQMKRQMKESQLAKVASYTALKEAMHNEKVAEKMQEAYDFFATKFNESVRRTARLQTMLAEASKRNGSSLNGNQSRTTGDSDNLRKKLAETNLFNMKLLYTNKLLQNESLTKRQKADVIERLDEASTEREVKLVYESLVKTLSSKSTSLTEGANRVIGSSSAPTRPASTVLNEGFESDRWAKLAGIK